MDAAVTILWFARELVLLSAGGLQRVEMQEKADEVGTLLAALQALEPGPRRVRLIYQPAELELHTVDCIRGNRTLVGSLLAEEHPIIRNPVTAWALSRLQPSDNGFTALLWVDPKSRLARLRTALSTRGIRLEGAWPLVSLFERIPPTDDPERPALAVMLTDAAGFVYAMTPGGARTVVTTTGAEFRGQLSGMVRNALSHFDASEPPPILVVDASSEGWNLQLSPLPEAAVTRLGLDQLLGVAAELPGRGLDNFSPPESRVNAATVLYGIAAACALMAVANLGLYARDCRRVRHDAAARAAVAQQLAAECVHLEQNRRAVERMEALEREINVRAADRLQLVAAVMQHKPVELTVHAITIEAGGFEIVGTIHEGVGQSRGPFYRFVDALGGGDRPWVIAPESRPPVLTSSGFTIKGAYP